MDLQKPLLPLDLQKPLLPCLRERNEHCTSASRICPAEATPTATPKADSQDCFDEGPSRQISRSSSTSTQATSGPSSSISPFGFGPELSSDVQGCIDQETSVIVTDVEAALPLAEQPTSVDLEANVPIAEHPSSSVQASAMPMQSSGECTESSAAADAKGATKTLTTAEATFTLVNWIACSAFFSVPLVFSRSGFSAGLLIVFGCGSLMYTAWLLGEVLLQLEARGISQPSFAEAAQHAFGRGGASFVSVVYHMELASYAISNLIVQLRTLTDLVGLSLAQSAALSVGFCAILSGFSDKVYAYVSLLSTVAFWIGCSTVFASAWELPEWSEASRLTGDPRQLPPSFSIILFCLAVHPLLPSLYASSKSKQDYERAAGWAYTVMGLFMLLFGAAAYYIYGDAVQPLVTHNIGRDMHMHKIPSLHYLATFAAWWVLCKQQLSMKSFIVPFSKIFADLLHIENPGGQGGVKSVLLSLPTLGILLAASIVFKDSIEGLMSGSGMFLQNLNAIVFPTLMYLRVCNPPQIRRWLGALALCMFGVMLIAVPLSLRLLTTA